MDIDVAGKNKGHSKKTEYTKKKRDYETKKKNGQDRRCPANPALIHPAAKLLYLTSQTYDAVDFLECPVLLH